MSEKMNIEIVELENPYFASMSEEFKKLIYGFYSQELNIPTITYESLHNYICQIVEGIAMQRRAGTNPANIHQRVLLGYANGSLVGFCVFYMLNNRMPHVSCLDLAYMFVSGKYPRVTEGFCQTLRECKKKWGARRISTTLTNDRLYKAINRLFKKAHVGGVYILFDDFKGPLGLDRKKGEEKIGKNDLHTEP
jgi:hypothetical protein